MKRPTGFTLIGLYCGWMAIEPIGDQIFHASGPYSQDPPSGVALLSAVFAAVAAEALWRCRPWCFRAFVGYLCIVDLAWFASVGNPASAPVTSELVTRLLLTVASILYVRSQALKLFGPPAPPRITLPAPRP